MWCQWVKSYYLIKGNNFWNLKIPGDCTWVWRKLLNLRPKVQSYMLSLIGNGHATSLWFDNWHPLGPLYAKFGHRVLYDSGLPKEATVSLIIHNSRWAFPVTQTLELNEIRSALPILLPSKRNEIDQVKWSLTSNGQFTISSLWDKLRTPFPKVLWHNLVWFSGHIPKCSFITWLAIQSRLSTADRLVSFGLPLSAQCSFCPENESHDHLFFNCPFSRQVWGYIQSKLHVSWTSRSWADWVSLLTSTKGRSIQAVLTKLSFTITVYQIWIERNVRKFQGNPSTWGVVVHKICSLVRTRILTLPNLPQLQADQFVNAWNFVGS